MPEPGTQTDSTTVSDGTEASWMDNYPSLADPEVRKTMSKYADEDAAMAGAVEAQRKLGKPYLLPETHDKLTDDQKTEIRANVAKMNGVPDSPDGYEIKISEDAKSNIDEQTLEEFKKFAHERDFSEAHVQELIDFQLSFAERQGKTRISSIENMQKTTLEQRTKDLSGDENAAALESEWIMRHLKKCAYTVDESGNQVLDKDMWKAFCTRNFFNNKGHELVLMRALGPWAKQEEATGGSPQAGGPMAGAKGSLAYKEMDSK